MIKVVQVFPQEDYTVYVYFVDGKVKQYDVRHLVGKGVFHRLKNKEFFIEHCTVLNHTLAWDISGTFDPYTCIDIDPVTIYENGITVSDPLEESA
jgi:hypothetical protein